MELNEAILTRRSIRKFTEKKVTDEEIRELLEAARWAPSWANTQVWEFVIVRDPSLKEKLVETYSETNPARKCSLAASVLIVACAKKGVAGCKEGKEATPLSNWYMFDLGLATQNFCLKAHQMGLGTVVVGFFDHKKCAELLKMPEGYTPVVILPLGEPAVTAKQGPPRKELKEFAYSETFDNKFIS